MEKNIEDDIIDIKEKKEINNNEMKNDKIKLNEEKKNISSKSDFEQNIINAYLQLQNTGNNNNVNKINECEKYLIQ